MAFKTANTLDVSYDNKAYGNLISPTEWNANFQKIEEIANANASDINDNFATIASSGGTAEIGTPALTDLGETEGETSLVSTQLAALASGLSSKESTTDLTTKLNGLVKSVTYAAGTGIFTITFYNDTTTTIDTVIEKVPASMSLVEVGNITYLRITNQDGSYTQTDVTTLVNNYTFTDGNTIDFTTDGYSITAEIKDGSITDDKLGSALISTLEGYSTTASTAASTATTKANDASTSANNASASASTATTKATEASTSANSASASATTATTSATSSQSWAVGGTGTRTGEDTNNAKYWAEQSESKSDIATTKANEASASAATATTKANEANVSANTATTKANEASASASSASTSASTATTKASEASVSANNASVSATTATTKANEASTSASSVTAYAVSSQSWAVGGTGTREGEDTNNAKYWSEQAEAVSGQGLMTKLVYDTDDDGVVDNAEKLNGHDDTYFATSNHNHDEVYASLTHNHNDAYSPLTHNHDSSYANLVHSHDNYALQTDVGSKANLATTEKGSIVGAVNEVFTSASNGKTAIATAITGMGVTTSSSDSYATMATNIGQITTGVDTSDANAIATDIKSGKTAYVNGNKVTGTYALPTLSNAAAASDILTGKQAVDGSGNLITGTKVDVVAPTYNYEYFRMSSNAEVVYTSQLTPLSLTAGVDEEGVIGIVIINGVQAYSCYGNSHGITDNGVSISDLNVTVSGKTLTFTKSATNEHIDGCLLMGVV